MLKLALKVFWLFCRRETPSLRLQPCRQHRQTLHSTGQLYITKCLILTLSKKIKFVREPTTPQNETLFFVPFC